MINMDMWANEIINSPERKAIPIMTHPGIELCGHTVREAVSDGKIHFQAIKAVNERYPSAACTMIMDLTVEAEAFGSAILFHDHEIPTVVGRLLEDESAIENLQIPNLEQGRIPQYLRANQLCVEHIKDKPIFAGCIGPFSLASRLYDMSEIMMLCYSDPDIAHILLNKCAEFIKSYCQAIKETGVHGVVIAEPAAGLLPNEGCGEFSSAYIKKIVDELQDESFLIILHNCGNTGNCTEATLASGAKGFHFGNKINIIDVLEQCPDNRFVMGNIDPVGIFKLATADTLREETSHLLHQAGKYKNFILSSGCDIPPHTPLENIDAFYQALNTYNMDIQSTNNVMTKLLNDIFAQPRQFRHSLAYHTGNQFSEIETASQSIQKAGQVFIIGIGASYTAGIALTHAFKKHGMFCSLIDASELEMMEVFPANAVAIILSRSGKSIEIVKCADICKRHRIPTIAITNDKKSPLVQNVDIAVSTAVAFDHSVSISTYSSLILVGSLIVLYSFEKEAVNEAIRKLTSACEYQEEHQKEWQERIEKSVTRRESVPTFFLGRSESYASARAGRLLWAEVAKTQSSCFATGNFRHGPQEMLSNKSHVVIWLSDQYSFKNDIKLIQDMVNVGTEVTVITSSQNPEIPGDIYLMPEIREEFQAAFNSVPVQMMSEALSRKIHVDCDSFVFCNFVVTSEAGI